MKVKNVLIRNWVTGPLAIYLLLTVLSYGVLLGDVQAEIDSGRFMPCPIADNYLMPLTLSCLIVGWPAAFFVGLSHELNGDGLPFTLHLHAQKDAICD